MNLSFLIAKRYFFSKKKTSFISLIANISMLGVGVGVMTLVVVLSVFNGLEDFQRSLFKSFDSDLKISVKTGKNFELTPALLQQIKGNSAVKSVMEVIQESCLLKYQDAQMVVNMKGVDETILAQEQIKKSIIEGNLKLTDGPQNYAVVGSGVYVTLDLRLMDFINPIEAWYPRNTKSKTLNFSAGEDAFNRMTLLPSGIFSIEAEYNDNYVLVPLKFAQELFDYDKKRTALEVQIKEGNDIDDVKKTLEKQLGEQFLVQNQDEQHATLLRAIKVEKFITFLILVFILGIASFNIFFSLSMLAIEKKEDVRTLYAMGATPTLVKRIFLAEGAIVGLTGAIVGLILGFLLCLSQQTWGFVKMGIFGGLIDAYPVKMNALDFISTAIVVVFITMLASYFPAKRAAGVQLVK
jgi:lipoprotein-releasing system permease protein